MNTRLSLLLVTAILVMNRCAFAQETSKKAPIEAKEESPPGHYGLLIDLSLQGRAFPLLGGGPGLLLAAKLDRFNLGGGFDIIAEPSSVTLVPRVEGQWAFVRSLDRHVELHVLAGFGWTMFVADKPPGYYGPDYRWGPARAGIGIRYWPYSTFGVYLDMGADVSPSSWADTEGDSRSESINVTPFARLGMTFAITK